LNDSFEEKKVALGAVFGVAFGVAIGNVGLGIVLGVAIGAAMYSTQKKKIKAEDSANGD